MARITTRKHGCDSLHSRSCDNYHCSRYCKKSLLKVAIPAIDCSGKWRNPLRGSHVREPVCSRTMEEEDGRMTKAARIAAFFIALFVGPADWLTDIFRMIRRRRSCCDSASSQSLFLLWPGRLAAQTDCLACHADKTMQDAAGHSISVDGDKFGASIHGSLQCNNCHADIKEYPASRPHRQGRLQNLPRRRSIEAHRQRSLLFQRASLHQLPRQCARDLSQG